MEDPHEPTNHESVQRNGYYPRNQKRKIKMIRTRVKNDRGKNDEKGVLEYPRRKKFCSKAKKEVVRRG